MKPHRTVGYLIPKLLPLLLAGAGMAQLIYDPYNPTQTQMFGMIGVAFNQTARLNVVNSFSPTPTAGAVAPLPCKVTLQIFDDQNNKLQELAIDNLAPGKAAHLDYVRPMTSTPQRVQVRGVMTATLSLPTDSGTTIPPVRVVPAACTVISTLEIFDNDTGKTIVILTNPASPAFFSGRF